MNMTVNVQQIMCRQQVYCMSPNIRLLAKLAKEDFKSLWRQFDVYQSLRWRLVTNIIHSEICQSHRYNIPPCPCHQLSLSCLPGLQ